MTESLNVCMDPEVYPADGASFAETRAITLSKYLEKELDPDLETRLREHLTQCDYCTGLIRELQDVDELNQPATVIHAKCPSSADLDQYAGGRLQDAMRAAISRHLEECPLCKGEAAWLASLAPAERISEPPLQRRNWAQYGAIAAALFFMALSLYLLSERASLSGTEARLRAAAVIKSPSEIDYDALQESAVPLSEKMIGVYEKGIDALKRQSYQEAIRHLEIVTTSQPDHSGALYLLGYSYYHMRQHEKAFQLCDRAEQISPHSLERCLSLVNIALKTGHYSRAIEEISGLYHAAPDHPEVKSTYERITSITSGRTLRL